METKTRARDDRGSAMIITLMVMALVTALATTVATLTLDNLQGSWRAQQAGSAVNAADAGVAQAVSYLRNNGVRDLDCSPTCGSNPWGNKANPATVTVTGAAGQAYQAWIEPVAAFPAHDPALYRIHSTGTAKGSASRAVVADVQVSTVDVPKGIFARTINGGGDASVHRQSIFSTGCVYNRSKIEMEGTDLAYDIPVGVHSSQIITDSNGSGQYCPTTNKPIHREPPQYNTAKPCNDDYAAGHLLDRRYDQDRLGGGLAGTTCESAEQLYPQYYGAGSKIEDDETLFELFGIRDPALTEAQVDQLRMIAQSQGNHWTTSAHWTTGNTSGWTSPDESNAVMFFDLTHDDPGGTVDLNHITGFSRDADLQPGHAGCQSKSLIIIIEGGNVKLNSNQRLFASLFLTSSAPYGQVFKANGTSQFIGTIYADTVNLTGTADISMDPCFLDNPSPALLDLAVTSYREKDRED